MRAQISPPLPAPVPPEAAPVVWALVLEVIRRLPCFLGRPPALPTETPADPASCSEAVSAFLSWLDAAPASLGDCMEEIEGLLNDLARTSREADAATRRLVQHARTRTTDHAGLSQALDEIAGRLSDPEATATDRARDVLPALLRTLRAEAAHDRESADHLAEQVRRIRHGMEVLRQGIERIERKTREVRTLSLRDGLTGLWNRAAWDQRVQEEIARAGRYEQPFSVLLWSVDGLGAIRERRGHPVADGALQVLAGRVLGALRRSDFSARYGHAQFAVLLPNTPGGAARIVARKIRRLAGERPVPAPDTPLEVSVSVGVATWQAGDSAEALMARASSGARAPEPRAGAGAAGC